MGYLSGPLTISIQHAGVGGVYERSGPPSIWGGGLVHEDIEGVDDNPVFVGEAQGPVDAPRAVMGATAILGLLAVVALGAAVLMPSHDDKQKRTNSAGVPAWLLRRKARIAQSKRDGTYLKRKRKLGRTA